MKKYILILYLILSQLYANELTQVDSWIKLSANTQNFYSTPGVFDIETKIDLNSDVNQHYFKEIDVALDSLVKHKYLLKISFSIDIRKLDEKTYANLQDSFGSLVMKYGRYTTMEMTGFSARLGGKIYQDGELAKITARIPVQIKNVYVKAIKEAGAVNIKP